MKLYYDAFRLGLVPVSLIARQPNGDALVVVNRNQRGFRKGEQMTVDVGGLVYLYGRTGECQTVKQAFPRNLG